MKNIYLQTLDLVSFRNDLVLATIISATGSTPQKAGCSAVLGPEGVIAGTIGGGRVENEISHIVKNHSKNGYYTFSLNSDIEDKNESICGGRMDILVDADPLSHRSVFEDLASSLKKGPGLLTTRIQLHRDKVTIDRQWSESIPEQSGCLMIEEENSLVFTEPLYPTQQLIIAGAGHIGKALANLGNLLGFEITVIDDRPGFINKKSLPDADHLITGNIAQYLESTEKNSGTFIVIATHGHSKDAEALQFCIRSGAAYIGMIGSKRKIALMREKFIEQNWATPEEWDRIHAPVGLDIGSQSVEEIAVSIAAELVMVKNSKIQRNV